MEASARGMEKATRTCRNTSVDPGNMFGSPEERKREISRDGVWLKDSGYDPVTAIPSAGAFAATAIRPY